MLLLAHPDTSSSNNSSQTHSIASPSPHSIISTQPGLQPSRAVVPPERSASSTTHGTPQQAAVRPSLTFCNISAWVKRWVNSTMTMTKVYKSTKTHMLPRIFASCFFALDSGMWRVLAVFLARDPTSTRSATRLRQKKTLEVLKPIKHNTC